MYNVFFLFKCFLSLGFAKNFLGSFLKPSYNMKVGQTLLLNKSSRLNKNIKWLYEGNILHINKLNMVDAISEGQAEITASVDNESFLINIRVFAQDPVKFFFSESNINKDRSEIILCVITFDNSLDKIKFKIINSKSDEIQELTVCENKKNGSTLVWDAKVGNVGEGKYKIQLYYLKNEVWTLHSTNYLNVQDYIESMKFKTVSEECVNFIARNEGFSSKAYLDPVGIITIGYGNIVYPGNVFYNNLTREEAKVILKNYIKNSSLTKSINNFLNKNNIICNQNQFDALLSFSYNLGTAWINNKNSNLKKIILNIKKNKSKIKRVKVDNYLNLRNTPNIESEIIGRLFNDDIITIIEDCGAKWNKVKTQEGNEAYCYKDFLENMYLLDDVNKQEFIREFSSYHHIKDKCIPGLLLRRFRELDIFFKGNYHVKTPNISSKIMLKKFDYIIPFCITKEMN